MLSRVLGEIPPEKLALHFHDTRGTALANVLVGLELGIATIDSARRRPRRLSRTRRAPRAISRRRISSTCSTAWACDTGIDLDALVDCSTFASALVGHDLPSKYWKAAIGERARGDRGAGNASAQAAVTPASAAK